MVMERSLVVIKPDAVARSLVGDIIARFEKTGLKIIAMKMVWVDDKFAKEHYTLDEAWAKNVFDKTKKTREAANEPFPYKDHMEYGGMIQGWNATFLQEGPVIAMVIEGPHAVEIIRKMIGSTEPRQATPGTIRGDYAMIESYALANDKNRVLRNLTHASDSVETAQREIKLWFTAKEIHSYKKEMDKHL
jgi:nucleoside-diphosphate kinase